MSERSSEESLARRRYRIGKKYAKKYSLTIKGGDAETETSMLYQDQRNHHFICSELRKMGTPALAYIIEATPGSLPGRCNSVPLLLPRCKEHGLESLNSCRLSGRDYLEVMAHLAIIGAVYDYLKVAPTRIVS